MEALLAQARPKLGRLLARFRIPPEDAQDLVQDALLSVVERWEQLHDREAWVISSVKYGCLLYWRARRRRLVQAVDDALLEALSPAQGPSQRSAQAACDLAKVMPAIPRRCRSVLRLRYGLELKPVEVAEELGYQPSSMSNIIRRCVAALTRCLLAVGYPAGERRA